MSAVVEIRLQQLINARGSQVLCAHGLRGRPVAGEGDDVIPQLWWQLRQQRL